MSTYRPVFEPTSPFRLVFDPVSGMPVFGAPPVPGFMYVTGTLTDYNGLTWSPGSYGRTSETLAFHGVYTTWQYSAIRDPDTLDYIWKVLIPPADTDSGLWEARIGVRRFGTPASLNYSMLKDKYYWYIQTVWTSNNKVGSYTYNSTVGYTPRSDDVDSVEVSDT
jgi:hypothetical protein